MMLTKRHPARGNPIYYCAIIASIVFLVFGSFLMLYGAGMSQAETASHIDTATEQICFGVDSHVSEEFSVLSSIALMGNSLHTHSATNRFPRVARSLMAHNAYLLVGFADQTGHAVTMDRENSVRHTDIADSDYFGRAMAGEQVLTRPVPFRDTGENVTIYALPVLQEGTPIGVLFAADPESELRIVVENALYAGEGHAHIIDATGMYVSESGSPLSLGISDNVYTLREPMSPFVEATIRKDLAAGRAGSVKQDFSDGTRHVAYAPLRTNGWFVFYMVHEGTVLASTQFMLNASVGLLALGAVVFLFFLLILAKANARRRKMLEKIAFEDPVTRQPNTRKLLMDMHDLLKRNPDEDYTVWRYEIPSFKYINALFGHNVSKRLLQYWARYLAEQTGDGESFGHSHKDVFYLLRKCPPKGDFAALFQRDAAYLAAYPALDGPGYRVDLAAGVYRPGGQEDSATPQDMMDRAEEALEMARSSAGTRLGVYSAKMYRQKLWEIEMDARKETALQNREFSVYWQPKVAIQGEERIYGMEALVRWTCPDKGVISPGEFIPLFERNGFIVKLDRFVFREACRQYAALGLAEAGRLVMSVNVSHLDILQPRFVEVYTEIRDAFGIPAGCVDLEFTESYAFENHVQLAAIIQQLHQNGFLCSLDDFGAGYSSLNILRTLHVDVLKLDRQFFRFDAEAARGEATRGEKLVASVLAMARELGMETVAEGVDNEATLDLLRRMGCSAVQGYSYAKPMPPGEFLLFWQAWRAQGGLPDMS